MSELHFQPVKGRAREILKAILSSPEVSSCHMKVALTLRLVCEEIVTNVTSYAYPEGADGFLDVDIQKTDRLVLRFTDGGVPFNPLEQQAPDINQSWKQRHIGGLGILLIRKKMDDVRYARLGERNVLTVEKVLPASSTA